MILENIFFHFLEHLYIPPLKNEDEFEWQDEDFKPMNSPEGHYYMLYQYEWILLRIRSMTYHTTLILMI
jgi:hypothetical protein